MGSGTIIELNGKRYDAKSGTLLGISPHAHSQQHSHTAKIHHGRTIDGVMSRKSGETEPARHTAAQTHSKSTPKTSTSKSKNSRAESKSRPSHAAAKSLQPHQPEKSKTLMRRSVHQPQVTRKPAIKTTAPAELAPASLQVIQPKLSVVKVNPLRLSHAKLVNRSASIRRFSLAQSESGLSAAKGQVAHIPIQPAPRITTSDIRSAQPQQPADRFEAAIAQATAHLQQPPTTKRRGGYLLGLALSFVAFIFAAGVFVYCNRSALEIRLASSRAGFHAGLPALPTDYRQVGTPAATKQSVTLTFASGDSLFKLTQQPSDLNSQSLLHTNPAIASSDYQTIVAGDALIYRYGGTDATWVDHGILFTLTGNADLTNDQIITLATSL